MPEVNQSELPRNVSNYIFCKYAEIIPTAGLGACVCKYVCVHTSVGLPSHFKICGKIKYICVTLKMLVHCQE